jgi:WhiB family redox-sensing transcriptional regulator
VTAVAEAPSLTRMPSGARAAMVLEHLQDHPGLTAGEIGRAFGLRTSMLDLLRRLEQRAQVVAVTSWMPDQGKPARRWQIAPPGIVPSPRPPADPQAVARQRERDRLATRARRARARGLHVDPGLEPPSLKDRPAVAADLGDAACRTEDPELFFPPDDERPADRKARVARAVAACHECPVQAACYAAAVANGERHGVWGGVDFTQSRRQRRAS